MRHLAGLSLATTAIIGGLAAAPGPKAVAAGSAKPPPPAVIKAFDAWEEPGTMTEAWFQ